MLGTIPETLSRIFARMSAKGLIQADGPRITLLDGAGLRELAEGVKRLA
jgi:CRP/FNR family transcriptional regulator